MRYTLTILLATTLFTTNVQAKNILCSNPTECELISQIMYQGIVSGFSKKMKDSGLGNQSFPVSYKQFKSYFDTCGTKETDEKKVMECLLQTIGQDITKKYQTSLPQKTVKNKNNKKKQTPQQIETDKKELEQQNEYWKNITPEELNNYLTKNPDINAKDKRSWTPLMWAAKESQNPEIIKQMLQKGADVNVTDNEGWTPFLFAIHKNQNIEVIQHLLNAGSDIHKTTDLKQNALHLAAKNNQNPQIIQMLINKGLSVNKKDKSEFKFTPIMYAVSNNKNPDVVYTLINNGALLHEKDAVGNSTLMLAALNNANIDIIQKLLDEKLVIDQRNKLGLTALHMATRNKNPKILEYLIEKGADKTAKFQSVDTLGAAAMFASQPEIINILIQNDFDVNTKYNVGTLSYMEQLNSALKQYDDKWTTAKIPPLVLACIFNENPNIIQSLINAGADVNERLFFGYTPLFFAVLNKNTETTKTLISNGAKTHIRAKDKSTPLTLALKNPINEIEIDPQTIELLVTHGVDINAKTSDNKTALLIAAEQSSNPEIIETLINLGADIKIRDDNGKMVLDYAKKNPHLKNTKTYQKLKELYFKK